MSSKVPVNILKGHVTDRIHPMQRQGVRHMLSSGAVRVGGEGMSTQPSSLVS